MTIRKKDLDFKDRADGRRPKVACIWKVMP